MDMTRLYELVLNYKSSIEARRDEINKYYTSLFVAFISLIPFIDKFAGREDTITKSYNIRYILIISSCLGIVLSISWKLVLHRILSYIKGMEELLCQIEKDFEIGFITYMFSYLDQTNSPAQVTKNQMLVPNTFIMIFVIILIYCIVWCIL